MTQPPEPVSPKRDQRKVGWGVATGCGIPTLTYLVTAMLTSPTRAYGFAMTAVMMVCVAGLMTFGPPGKSDLGSGMLIGALAITIIGFPVCLGGLGGG